MDSKSTTTYSEIFELNKNILYKVDNNFAYKYETNIDRSKEDLKLSNFVPTYDRWCIYCGKKNVDYRCGRCKSVYFCDQDCQKQAHRIHKNHCNRNLFCVCICCGSDQVLLKCEKCPAKYCSNSCRNEIEQTHKEFDCKYFSKTFS